MEIALGARQSTSVKILNILAFSAFTALGAQVCIYLPFTPVPLTLQTLFVVLSGSFLGYKEGALSQLIYVAAGLAGLPVFSGGAAGFNMILGPTGGYLIGFAVASAFTGFSQSPKEQSSNAGQSRASGTGAQYKFMESSYAKGGTGAVFFRAWLLYFAGIGIIYLFGALNLSITFGYSFTETIQKGIIPFIPGDILKSALAAGISIKLIPAHRSADD